MHRRAPLRAFLGLLTFSVAILGVYQSPTAGQSCPTRISPSVISSFKNPQIRNALASAVIDQAFIDRNGGASAMMAAIKQQNDEFDKAIRQNENCVAQASQNPAAVRSDPTVAGSCRAALDQLREAKRAQEAWLPILQCWANQRRGGTASGGRPTNPRADPGWTGMLQGLASAVSALGRREATPVADETDWNVVQQRVAAMQDRVKATCGDPASFPSLLRLGTMTAEGVFVVPRSAVEALDAREREYQTCSQKVRLEFGDEAGGTPLSKPSFQPILGDVPSTSRVNNAAVEAILNAEPTAAPPRRLPFAYDMPRTNRPDRDFLKRISGELRTTTGQHEFSINVSDIDRNWLTTDQCAALDVTFQLTLAVDSGGVISRGFPLVVIPVTANDGTAGVRVPLILEQPGQPVGVEVKKVEARACGAPRPPESTQPLCTKSVEEKVALVALSQELFRREAVLTKQWEEMLSNLQSLRQEIRELREESSINAIRTRVSSVITLLGLFVPSASLAAQFGQGAASVAGTAVGALISTRYLKVMEEEKALGDALSGVTGFFKTRAASGALTALTIVENEIDLGKYKTTVASVIDDLDRQVGTQMRQMALIEARLGAIKVELSKLEAVCR